MAKIFNGTMFPSKKNCKGCAKKAACKKEWKSLNEEAILLDCEAFYYVYRKLEEEVKSPQYTEDTKIYEKELDSYMKKMCETPALIIPSITNGALAVELALKYLIFRKKKAFMCIHDLKKLYEDLHVDDRKIINDLLETQAHQGEKTLASSLQIISNSFDDWRYFFDSTNGVGSNNFFKDFVHIVCDYALSFKKNENEM